METRTVRLKVLLRQRHLQTYGTFCREYDKTALAMDADLVGTAPSRAQFYRWLSGDLEGLPYADHCQVLEKMFPGWTAAQLFEVCDLQDDRQSRPDEIAQVFSLIDAGLAEPGITPAGWSTPHGEARPRSASDEETNGNAFPRAAGDARYTAPTAVIRGRAACPA